MLPRLRSTCLLYSRSLSLRHQQQLSWRTMSTHAHQTASSTNGVSSVAHHFKKQRHLPFFLEYLMWTVFGSEALHLIWLKMEYKEYKEKTEHKIRLLEEIIDRIERGEEFNDALRDEIRMVLLNGRRSPNQDDIDDDYLEKLIAQSEERQPQEREITTVTKDPVTLPETQTAKKPSYFL